MQDTINREKENANSLTLNIEELAGFGSGGVSPGSDVMHEMCTQKSMADSKERIAAFLATNGLEEKVLVKMDIRGHLATGWRWRDQYARGTCTAFAVVAAVELLVANFNESKQRLSPEFVYWNMRYNPKYMLKRDVEVEGTKLKQALGVLVDLGVPEEISYPYPRHDPGANNQPSPVVLARAAKTRMQQSEYWDIVDHGCPITPTVMTIYKELANGRPVCVGLPMFKIGNNFKNNWKNRASVDTGIVYGPGDKMNEGKDYQQVSAHVVTIVGFQPERQKNGGGWFIFKNSWGTQFGKHPRLPGQKKQATSNIGFGAISSLYLETFCWELLSLKRK